VWPLRVESISLRATILHGKPDARCAPCTGRSAFSLSGDAGNGRDHTTVLLQGDRCRARNRRLLWRRFRHIGRQVYRRMSPVEAASGGVKFNQAQFTLPIGAASEPTTRFHDRIRRSRACCNVSCLPSLGALVGAVALDVPRSCGANIRDSLGTFGWRQCAPDTDIQRLSDLSYIVVLIRNEVDIEVPPCRDIVAIG